jgi:hypothetical protein
VLVAESARSVDVILRASLRLSDPGDPATQQPYHAAFGRLEENARIVRARTARIRRAARAAVRALVDDCRAHDAEIVGAGLVVGSVIEPDTIANPHIRAHAFEGRLFRTVVENALSTAHIASRLFLERDVYAIATSTLDRSEADVRATIGALGKAAGAPWRADEKLAALAAWMILTEPQDGSRRRAPHRTAH